MSKNPKKLEYYSFFSVEKCIEISESSVILLVSFNLWEDKSVRPKEGILKISKHSEYNKHEAENQKLASRLHPSILQIYHSQDAEIGYLYFLEYCKGLTLGRYLQTLQKSPKTFNLNNFSIAYTLKSIIKSIQILHSAKLAHRDVKLENIFVTFENYLKLGDFGSSKLISKDQYQTLIHTEGYQSPQISNKDPQRNPFKDDVWAFGVLFMSLAAGSKINLDRKTQNEVFDLTKSLNLDDKLKTILSECLQCDEKTRKTSKEVYNSLRSYICHLCKQIPQEITEKDYYNLKKIKFQSNKIVTKIINQLKIVKINKDRCVICQETNKATIFYRQFHKVHIECLYIQFSKSINLHRCVICNLFDPYRQAEDTFRSLSPNQLMLRTCNTNFTNQKLNFESSECSHFLSALNDKYQSIVYKCQKTQNSFCSLCSFSKSHIHCLGYIKHLKNYEKKYIISKKNNEKIVLKKYKLLFWQIKECEPKFREFQIMKKFESNGTEINGIHIHEFLSSISDDFVKVDFWYEKSGENKQIFAFYEYLKGKTLLNELIYRRNNGLGFISEEIELLNEFKNRVLKTMHKHSIYHTWICLQGIYIEVNSFGIIQKFKLGKFRKAQLFGGKQEEYKNYDESCFEYCLAQLSF